MPAKPKRGTVPSLDGVEINKRITFVKRKLHFRPIRPCPRPAATRASPHEHYVCAFRPFPPIRPQTLFMGGFPHIYICLKDTKQKNTSRIYVRARMRHGRMGGNGRNPEIRTISTFARVFYGRNPGRNGRGHCAQFIEAFRPDDSRPNFRLPVGARNAISCAQGAENAFPAFSERMTPSGTLYSRLVPDGPFCSSTETGCWR